MTSSSSQQDNDLRRIVNGYLKEISLIASGQDGTWEKIAEKSDVTIYKKRPPPTQKTQINCMKGVGIIHASPKSIFEFVSDPENVKLLDEMANEVRVVKRIDPNLIIMYMSSLGKFTASSRDFCVAMCTKIEEDGTYIQCTHSVTDKDVPEVRGKIRGELLTSGFVIKPIKVNGYKDYCSLVTYVVQFDPKGWVPTYFTNKISEEQPLRIVKLRTFIPQHTPSNESDSQTTTQFIKEGKQEESVPSNHGKHPSTYNREEDSDSDDDEEAEYSDAVSDFAESDMNSHEDLKAVVDVLQKQMTQMQSALQKTQSQVLSLREQLQLNKMPSFASMHNAPIQKLNSSLIMDEVGVERRMHFPLTGRKKWLLVFLLVVWPFVTFAGYRRLKRLWTGEKRMFAVVTALFSSLLWFMSRRVLLLWNTPAYKRK